MTILLEQASESEQHEFEVPHTTLTDIIEEDARLHPDMWSDQTQPLFGQHGYLALNPSGLGVDFSDYTLYDEENDRHEQRPETDDATVYAHPISSKALFVGVYGSRWSKASDGRTVLQSTPLERLPEIHHAIIQGVLIDEHSRPARLVPHAAQNEGFTNDNLRLWNQEVHAGNAPIIATGNLKPDGTPVYHVHDFADYHPLSSLLWGRATQDRVTKASGYEDKRRESGMPPFSKGEGLKDGTGSVDKILCCQPQIELIDYAMFGPGSSPKERMATAWQLLSTYDFESVSDDESSRVEPIRKRWADGQNLDPGVAAYNISQLAIATKDLENFIQWYESDGGRRATDEQKTIALKDALTDITRVAEKLLGTYDGTDLVLSDSELDVIAAEEPVISENLNYEDEATGTESSTDLWIVGDWERDHSEPSERVATNSGRGLRISRSLARLSFRRRRS